MKRVGHLFEKLCSFENLYEAAQKAQLRKRYKPATAEFHLDLEANLLGLRDELSRGDFRFAGYKSFYVREPKERFISAAPYRDRVVHHAICNVIDPIFEKSLIDKLYSNRLGKGAHRAVDQYQTYCRKYKYVLKCDIRKYFASVDHNVLFRLIQGKIKDERMLDIIWMVVDGFHADPDQPGTGMPLGNLTSQLFANLYLSPLDHHVTETLGFEAYCRYCDDFVVFSDDRGRLAELKKEIAVFLDKFRLQLHPFKSRIWEVRAGVPFLGYRVFPGHRRVSQQNVRRFKGKLSGFAYLQTIGACKTDTIERSVSSWYGHVLHADTLRLRQKLAARYNFARDWLVKPFL